MFCPYQFIVSVVPSVIVSAAVLQRVAEMFPVAIVYSQSSNRERERQRVWHFSVLTAMATILPMNLEAVSSEVSEGNPETNIQYKGSKNVSLN